MFGLSGKNLRLLMEIILDNADLFHQVTLFGSRARGDASLHSDVDLAVSYRIKSSKFQADLEQSLLPLSVDVIDLSLEKETKLLAFIKSEGVLLFDDRNVSIGERWMAVSILHEKLADFQKALKRLQEALSKDIESDDLFLDGAIQRFEFTYELSWKLMKAYLMYLGVEANSPRMVIREGVKQGIIHETDDWFDMITQRNNTTHAYHKDIALAVYSAVEHRFIQLFVSFEKRISKQIKAISNDCL